MNIRVTYVNPMTRKTAEDAVVWNVLTSFNSEIFAKDDQGLLKNTVRVALVEKMASPRRSNQDAQLNLPAMQEKSCRRSVAVATMPRCHHHLPDLTTGALWTEAAGFGDRNLPPVRSINIDVDHRTSFNNTIGG